MNYYHKNVRYLKFYEDIKMIKNDEHNNRLAIVFYGKERIVHIFESSNYTNYMPIQLYHHKEKVIDTENNLPAPMEIVLPKKNDIDIQKLFHDIRKDQKQLIPQVMEENNQQYIIYNYQMNTKTAENPFQVTNFEMSYEPKINSPNVELSFLKPKVKNKLLSVIATYNINGIEWFSFQKDIPLLLIVNTENSISVYKLRTVDHNKHTLIDGNELQGQPFCDFPEQWFIYGNATQSIPIKDYYLKKSSDNVYKLYTVHIDNSLYFWYIVLQNNTLKITPTFSVTLDYEFTIENILIDRNETFLYCFNHNGIQIYKLSDFPPFKLIYIHNYDYNKSTQKKRNSKVVLSSSSSSSNSSSIDEELIDVNAHFKNEEDTFFQGLQKPIFSLFENVVLIQLYDNNKEKYSLFYFNAEGLIKIFEDFSFLERCIKGTETTLIQSLFESGTNFSFCFSPSLYLKNKMVTSIQSEIKSNDILNSLHQILLISLEKENMFIQIPSIIPVDTKLNCLSPLNSFKIKDSNNKEYKPIVAWFKNNTIIISSLKHLFTLVKYCNEIDEFGYPVSYDKIKSLFQ